MAFSWISCSHNSEVWTPEREGERSQTRGSEGFFTPSLPSLVCAPPYVALLSYLRTDGGYLVLSRRSQADMSEDQQADRR